LLIHLLTYNILQGTHSEDDRYQSISIHRPKLVLQAFHLCKARSKVENAEVIWDTLADLATPLRIADLEKLPKLTQLERDRIVKCEPSRIAASAR
jgi:hypothetical protein